MPLVQDAAGGRNKESVASSPRPRFAAFISLKQKLNVMKGILAVLVVVLAVGNVHCHQKFLNRNSDLALGMPPPILPSKRVLRKKRRRSSVVQISFDRLSPSTSVPRNMIWPHPKSVMFGNTSVCINSEWNFALSNDCMDTIPCQDLFEAFERYKKMMFDHTVPLNHGNGCLAHAEVTVQDTSAMLDFGIDESYALNVTQEGITLISVTVYGAMRALESLSQLVRFDFMTKYFTIPNAPWQVRDSPRFKQRQLLVDSSRHFLPMTVLKNLISSLPSAKINTLHWHLTDIESFPYCSQSQREFCRKGAFSYQEHYTREDLVEVVSFARMHGVRVIPEIDIPGHSASWCGPFPEICTKSRGVQMLSPVMDKAREVIANLVNEIVQIFPDSFIHLGGDEVKPVVWDADKSTSAWMKKKMMTSNEVYHHFVRYSHQLALSLGKIPVGWNEIIGVNVRDEMPRNITINHDSNVVIQIWTNYRLNPEVAKQGYKILHADTVWYFDYLDVTWEQAYAMDPCLHMTEKECELVLGGGGYMWTEKVDTSNLGNTIWPRVAAIAERLWSPKGKAAQAQALRARFQEFRCLLHRRGIAAAPNLRKAGVAPTGPGSCFAQ